MDVAEVAEGVRATVGALAHPGGATCRCPAGESVLVGRGEAYVLRHGDTVAKAHAADTGERELALRVRVAADPALRGTLLAPLEDTPRAAAGRHVTLWPFGAPVDPDAPERAPWEAAGRLLALLHRVDTARLPGPPPPMRGPAKAARAVALLRAAGPREASADVLAAWEALPPWARGEAPAPRRALCHGDLHLGQLVRHPAPEGPWRLIDVDDLGLGEPAWDLARPAAWYGCGLLGPAEWDRFLRAYRAAGGPAVPADGDPWPHLDVPARALAVQTAARALTKAHEAGRPLDEAERAVAEACGRMASAAVAAPGDPYSGPRHSAAT
ncbi:phosphotransferase family protein [Streptomyces sp. NPDC050560]|uniref:phosphotransferase family protein n=1 Tax=Streptomyces sp. NPDC050560 TaxID=3365630 RepID=UPI003791F040